MAIPLPTPTKNPVPSTDIRDHLFAGAKIDEFVTSDSLEYMDRLGGKHFTQRGLEENFQEFLASSGYIFLGDYESGPLQFTARNQYIRYNGQYWKLNSSTNVGFVTTGNDASSWVNDINHFALIDGDNLRQELAGSSGASLVKLMGKSVSQLLLALSSRSDQFSSLEEWAAYPAKKKVFVGGEYTINSTLYIQCEQLDTEGKVKINPTSEFVALHFGNNNRSLLTTLTSTITKGLTSLTVSGVNEGDVLCIWNPADYSWSGYRDYYRQGEFVKVIRYESGVAYFAGGINDTYPEGTRIYKIQMDKCSVRGEYDINFPTYSANALGMQIEQVSDSDLNGLKLLAKNTPYALQLKRCMNVSGDIGYAIQKSSQTSGLDYGLYLLNCQSCKINGLFCAERHGSTMTGNGDECSIVNRFNRITGTILTTGQGGVAAADFHANCEKCSYGGYMQGLVISGHKNGAPNSHIDSVPNTPLWPTIIASDCKSLDFDLSNTHITGSGDPESTNRGCIDIGGNSDAMSDKTTLQGTLNLSNAVIDSPATFILNVRNRGSLTKHDINLTGITINGTAGKRAIRISSITGSDPGSVMLAGISITSGMQIDIPTASKKPGLTLSGQASVTVKNGSSNGSTPVTFPWIMPGAPASIVSNRTGAVSGVSNSKVAASSISPVNTGFNAYAYTVDGSNLANGDITATINWVAYW